MPRDPFAFLDAESPQRKTLLLLLAILKKNGGEVELTLEELTSIDDGASFYKYPSDTGTKLVLRFARKGAEAYFLTGEEQSSPKTSRRDQPLSQTRHAIHDDIDLAMREEEMAQRAVNAQREQTRRAKAEAGVMPWTTRQ
jgi:hypothetical protein